MSADSSRYTEDDNAAKAAAEVAGVKTEPTPSIVKAEESAIEQEEQNGDGDQQMYGGEQDMDDEIDFNLGGNSNGYDAPKNDYKHEEHGPGIKEDG